MMSMKARIRKDIKVIRKDFLEVDIRNRRAPFV